MIISHMEKFINVSRHKQAELVSQIGENSSFSDFKRHLGVPWRSKGTSHVVQITQRFHHNLSILREVRGDY